MFGIYSDDGYLGALKDDKEEKKIVVVIYLAVKVSVTEISLIKVLKNLAFILQSGKSKKTCTHVLHWFTIFEEGNKIAKNSSSV